MRVVACAIILASLVGCASKRPPEAMSYVQLNSIRTGNISCNQIESVVANMEQQLRLKGLTNVDPEDLSESDRLYNAKARIVIWSMRISCNNPDRYKK